MTTITIPTITITTTFTTTFTLSPGEIVSAGKTVTKVIIKKVTETPTGDITQATNVEQIFGLLFGFIIFTILLICFCNCKKNLAIGNTVKETIQRIQENPEEEDV
jgi:hypothetical protein